MIRLTASAGILLAATVSVSFPAGADPERSAAIPQVQSSTKMEERSNAAFEQIVLPGAGTRRGGVDQIDPALFANGAPDGAAFDLDPSAESEQIPACTLTPEQQSIVTSLEAQGRLPAGDCEMVAWFAKPADKSEEDRRALAAAVLAAAPELVGQESDEARASRLEAERLAAEAVAAAVLTYLLPITPVDPGK
jgi:hypothetical protein